MDIKVSVILPSLNVSSYINECIESVLNQSLRDIEVICVDAGSTDGTLEIIQEYILKDQRVKLVHSNIKSYGYQMNIGIDLARGKYIGIVETDDFIKTDMYEELYQLANQYDVDFIKSDFYRFTQKEDGTLNLDYNSLTVNADYKQYYNQLINPQENLQTFFMAMNTWCGIYKRDFLNQYHIRHNESLGASYQDNGFWFQTLMYAEKVYFLNKPFYMNRRDNPNSSVYNREKVYCICEEYDFIQNIVDKDINFKKKYIYLLSLFRYKNYIFSLYRIADQYKLEFLIKLSKDFIKLRDQGNLSKSVFSEPEWTNLVSIMSDPNQYYVQTIQERKELVNLASKFEHVIIYGAGMVGKDILNEFVFAQQPINILSFAVSEKGNNLNEFRGIPIQEINDLIEYKKNSLVVIATLSNLHSAIQHTLNHLGFEHIVAVKEKVKIDAMNNIKLNPKTFNDKIQWLKCNQKLEDNIILREKIDPDFLIPLYGEWNDYQQINFDSLPNSFQLKISSNPERKIIIDDWININIDQKNEIRKKMNSWIAMEQSGKIYATQNIANNCRYNILTFHGEPIYVVVDTNVDKFGLRRRDIFDVNWHSQDFKMTFPKSEKKVECPNCFLKMLNIAKSVSANLTFANISFLKENDRFYWDALSYTLIDDLDGTINFVPKEMDIQWGKLINL